MSRIGKFPVAVPSGVNVSFDDGQCSSRVRKASCAKRFSRNVVDVQAPDGTIIVERKGDAKEHRAAHGLTRTLIANMVEGVSKGFRKSLEIQGVGYRVAKAGEKLEPELGLLAPGRVRSARRASRFRSRARTRSTSRASINRPSDRSLPRFAVCARPSPTKAKAFATQGETIRKKLGKAGKAGKK